MKNSLNNFTDNDVCKYNDEYNACSLYEFTITNNADVAQELKVSMSPTLNQYGNLYFIILEGNRTSLTTNSKIVHNSTHIEQDTINFNNLNLVLKPKESKTYTIVFYIKSLNIDQTSVDSGKTFEASIKVDSITTGYSMSTQVGEGCYDYVQLDDGTYKLTRFNGINHQTGDIIEGCGVTKDEDGYYSVTVPSTYGGNSVSTLGNSMFFVFELKDLNLNNLNNFVMTKAAYIKEVKIDEGITVIEDGLEIILAENNVVRYGLFATGGYDPITGEVLREEGVKVTLPNSLKYLGDYTFNQTLLKEIKLPNNLEYIGNRALANNDYIAETFIPASVKEIGDYAFVASKNIQNVTFEDNEFNPSQLTTIGRTAFSGKKIQILTIPSSVETIGNDAFSHNNISTLTIPNSVQTIGNDAFYDNDITTLTFEDNSSLTTIGNDAFNSCALDYQNEDSPLYLPKTITTMGELVFDNNPNLKYIYYEGDTTGFGISWNGNATLLPRRN